MRDDQSAADLRARGGLKWTYFDEDVLGAWVAEMDFGLAPPVAEALHEAVDRGDTGYVYPDAMRRVAEAGSEFWSDRLGWVVSPDRVFAVPDVVNGMSSGDRLSDEAGFPGDSAHARLIPLLFHGGTSRA